MGRTVAVQTDGPLHELSSPWALAPTWSSVKVQRFARIAASCALHRSRTRPHLSRRSSGNTVKGSTQSEPPPHDTVDRSKPRVTRLPQAPKLAPGSPIRRSNSDATTSQQPHSDPACTLQGFSLVLNYVLLIAGSCLLYFFHFVVLYK